MRRVNREKEKQLRIKGGKRKGGGIKGGGKIKRGGKRNGARNKEIPRQQRGGLCVSVLFLLHIISFPPFICIPFLYFFFVFFLKVACTLIII